MEPDLQLPPFSFATVESFNAAASPRMQLPAVGNGDMTGVLRLLGSGAKLLFRYDAWCEPFRYAPDDAPTPPYAPWGLRGYHTWGTIGNLGYSWPSAGACLMVHVDQGEVKLWAWPGLVLREAGAKQFLVDGRLIAVCDTAGLPEWTVTEEVTAPTSTELGWGVQFVGGVRDASDWMARNPLAPGSRRVIRQWHCGSGRSAFIAEHRSAA